MERGIVFLATIIVSAPEFGLAIVASAGGTANIKNMFIANLPTGDSGIGATPQANYTDGSTVICLKDYNSINRAYILAPASYAVADLEDTLAGKALYKVGNYTEADDSVFVNALEQLISDGSIIGFKNYSHGADIDALPGDYDITDQNGNAGIHVGRFLAQLRGSPLAFIDVSNITHAIRSVATKIEEHLPLSVVLKGKELTVDNIAVSTDEAFGSLDQGVPAINKGADTLWQDTEASYAIPFYRLQGTEGAAVDGKEELVLVPPADQTYHYCNTEPAIVAKSRTSFTGEKTEASAVGLMSVKSPAITGIHQVNYNADRGADEQDDILQPYERQSQEDANIATTETTVSDAAINKLIDTLFTGDYLEKLKQKMAEHGLSVASANGTLASRITKTKKLGPTDQQQYENPDSIILTDPVTGKQTMYFASTSFISQEPDGSILICDGYGSEIRMSKGNIYISPALDLFFRPGRDLSSMVPRHQSFNAQQHTTINSSKSIYIRAVQDLKMVGATGDAGGMVTLECASSDTSNDHGLLLKSKCGSALTGNDIYIGRNSGTGKISNRIEEPQTTGSIIIDACSNGVLSQRCGEATVDAGSICLVASNNAAASAVRIGNTSIGVYTSMVEIPASVQMVGKQSAEQITLFRDGAPVKLTLATDGTPSLFIEGSVFTGKGLTSNGPARICGQLAANGVASTSTLCAVIDRRYGDPFEPVKIKKLAATTGLGESAANLVASAARSVYQDYYIGINGFSFPETYGVLQNIVMPGMLWQQDETTLSTGRIWEETAVTNVSGSTTMCYPGFAVWENAKLSQRGYKLVSLRNNYITNTTRS